MRGDNPVNLDERDTASRVLGEKPRRQFAVFMRHREIQPVADHRGQGVDEAVGIDEKPVRNLFVNAGIYILSPDALDLIHPNTFFDMPTLFGMLAAQGKTTAAYPIHETWMDIGRVEEFERAKREWDLVAQS